MDTNEASPSPFPPRLSRQVSRRLQLLEDEIKCQRESGLINADLLMSLCSDVKKETGEPNLIQAIKQSVGMADPNQGFAANGAVGG